MMSERMQNAMALADKCWAKAWETHPDFVEQYLRHSEELLLSRQLVPGDEFRAHCGRRGLIRPAALHHNVWVSGPRALSHLGWIEKAGHREPEQFHNHMHIVTVWRSKIYGQ